MKTMFDPKSALMGVVGTVVIACVCGAMSPAGPDVGRFQIETSVQHAFVLDTTTGEVWEKYLPPNRGQMTKDFNRSKLDSR
jgi:hypothetical protein